MLVPALIAGLFDWSAIVWVGPPLDARAESFGSSGLEAVPVRSLLTQPLLLPLIWPIRL